MSQTQEIAGSQCERWGISPGRWQSGPMGAWLADGAELLFPMDRKPRRCLRRQRTFWHRGRRHRRRGVEGYKLEK